MIVLLLFYLWCSSSGFIVDSILRVSTKFSEPWIKSWGRVLQFFPNHSNWAQTRFDIGSFFIKLCSVSIEGWFELKSDNSFNLEKRHYWYWWNSFFHRCFFIKGLKYKTNLSSNRLRPFFSFASEILLRFSVGKLFFDSSEEDSESSGSLKLVGDSSYSEIIIFATWKNMLQSLQATKRWKRNKIEFSLDVTVRSTPVLYSDKTGPSKLAFQLSALRCPRIHWKTWRKTREVSPAFSKSHCSS